jgi:hypothetical protein
LSTSAWFEGGICHALASYVSMQTFPTLTESEGHWNFALLNAWTGIAHQQSAVKPIANVTCLIWVPP